MKIYFQINFEIQFYNEYTIVTKKVTISNYSFIFLQEILIQEMYERLDIRPVYRVKYYCVHTI